MKVKTFAAIAAAGVVTGVATYAICESGVVEKAEDFVADKATKGAAKVKGFFKKKAKAVVCDGECDACEEACAPVDEE